MRKRTHKLQKPTKTTTCGIMVPQSLPCRYNKNNKSISWVRLVFLVVTINVITKHQQHVVEAAADLPRCVRTVDCERALMKGSVCVVGFCTNPFYERGCIGSILEERRLEQQQAQGQGDVNDNDQQEPQEGNLPTARLRVCNSEDPPEALAAGHCRLPDTALDYTEIRIATQNWESAYIVAWMLQILLSEVLGVPVTLETGSPDVNLDFYNPKLSFGWGTSNDWKMMEASVHINSDCRQVPKTVVTVNDETGQEEESYQPCAHVTPEVWSLTGQSHHVARLRRDHVIESPTGLGVVGQQFWFIPRFAAQRDPTLLTYFGLVGEENRQKLADTFLRPTTWGDYCREVSPTACAMPDGIANRAPVDEGEEAKYFAGADTYKGHFRKTAENDCETYPDTCTGHIADYPCGWSSVTEQQAFHLDIALRSSGNEPGCRGYSYGELTQIMRAANATKSPFIMEWWLPDAMYTTFAQTDMEFQAISLPPASQQCMEARVSPQDRCQEDHTVRVGEPEGACEEPPYPLDKIVSTSLFEITQHPSIPVAQRSPAYELIKAFSVSTLQVGQLFETWLQRSSIGGTGFDLRYATCEWIVDSWDDINDWIPRSFPRVTQKANATMDDPLWLAAMVLGGVAAVATLVSVALTYQQRNRPVIRHAQVSKDNYCGVAYRDWIKQKRRHVIVSHTLFCWIR